MAAGTLAARDVTDSRIFVEVEHYVFSGRALILIWDAGKRSGIGWMSDDMKVGASF